MLGSNHGRMLALVGLMAFGFAGASCKKDEKAAAGKSTPECSQSFISSYNDLSSELETTKKIYNDDNVSTEDKYKQVKRFQAACQRFFAEHGAVSCRARNLSTDSVQTVGADDAKSACKEADDILAQPAT